MKRIQKLFVSATILATALVGIVASAQAAETFTCGTGSYSVTNGIASNGSTCTGALIFDASVTGVAPASFNSSVGLTSIVIPSTFTSLPDGAFAYDEALTTVTFSSPSHVTTIGQSVFRNDISLTSLTLPDSVTDIRPDAFFNAYYTSDPVTDSYLATFNFGSGIRTIETEAFVGARTSTLTFPASVQSIEAKAFWLMNNLTTIKFESPSQLTSIDPDAFLDDPRLTTVIICGTGPSVLTNYVFPNGVVPVYEACIPPAVRVTRGATPVVTGTAAKGRAVAVSSGTWRGTSPRVTYQWYRCVKQQKSIAFKTPTGCSVISRATKKSYVLTVADRSRYVLARVSATNSVSTIATWTKSTTKVK